MQRSTPSLIRELYVRIARRIPRSVRFPISSFLRSLPALRDHEAAIEDARSANYLCLFVGHPRSGSTLCAALLTAHPEVVLSIEADVLWLIRCRFDRRRIFALIFRNQAQWVEAGRTNEGYSYAVEGQWQGRYRELRVVGDKKAGNSALQLQVAPELLSRTREEIGLPLRVVQVVRNPFDNITTISRRESRPLDEAVEWYFRQAEGVKVAEQQLLEDEDLHRVRHERLVSDPQREIRRLCDFFDISAPDDYVHACARIVFPSPRRTRDEVDWPPHLVRRVEQRMCEFGFLEGYSFRE